MIYVYLKKIWDQEQYISNALVKMNDNKITEEDTFISNEELDKLLIFDY
jgi:hypothetical protein